MIVPTMILTFLAVVAVGVDGFATSSSPCSSSSSSRSFAIVGSRTPRSPKWKGARPRAFNVRTRAAADDEDDEPKLVDVVLTEMHDSGFPFRVVVVGNGAILETTSVLGPTMKSSVSPKTGDRLVTLASEDQSFEFHVKVDDVEKVVFAEPKKPLAGGGEKTLRICRFANKDGGSICSLILNDGGDEAVRWFDSMKERFAE